MKNDGETNSKVVGVLYSTKPRIMDSLREREFTLMIFLLGIMDYLR